METSGKPASKAQYIIGWVLSVAPCLLMIMSAVMKLTKAPVLVDGFTKFAWPLSLAIPIGIVEMICTVLYIIPRTAMLGAILLTGYLGGAIATHVRIGESFAPPAILGVIFWLGLYLRDTRVRALIPLR